jgi:hypothetical protein
MRTSEQLLENLPPYAGLDLVHPIGWTSIDRRVRRAGTIG